MENKKIVKQFIDNLFVDNDKAYDVVSENVRVNWPGFGMEDIVGKDKLREFLGNGGPDKVLNLKINNIIAENDIVIGEGTIVTERNSKTETSHFADVYTVNEGKIVALKSYMVFDKSNEQEM